MWFVEVKWDILVHGTGARKMTIRTSIDQTDPLNSITRRLRTVIMIGSLLLLILLSATAQAAISGDYEYTDNGDGTCTIAGYTGPGGDVAIPGTLDSLTVTTIGDNAFRDIIGLSDIIIPNSVTSIKNYVFLGCTSLTGITIGNSVTSIGDYAFSGCIGQSGIIIPDSVTSIGDRAFHNCTGLTNVTVGNGVTSIGFRAFSGCTGLLEITVDALNPAYSSLDGVLFSK